MYKICFYVPIQYAEQVKKAVFKTGAGSLENYTQCCWQTLGKGQFRPLANSHPFIGQAGKLEEVEELKVELLCKPELINMAIKALKETHPYEAPAYDVIKLEVF